MFIQKLLLTDYAIINQLLSVYAKSRLRTVENSSLLAGAQGAEGGG